MPSLDEHDRRRLKALWAERPAEVPREVSHDLFFLDNPRCAIRVERELSRRGFRTRIIDELSGSGYFHVTASRPQPITVRAINNARRDLESLALKNGGTYLDWTVVMPRLGHHP